LRKGIAGITWGAAVTQDEQHYYVCSSEGTVIYTYDKAEVLKWDMVASLRETLERLQGPDLEWQGSLGLNEDEDY